MSSVWEVLSKIDCSEHVEDKGNFSYLAWTWALAMVKENYPEATYRVKEDKVYPDGTMEVRTEATIDGLTLEMWLPVLNYQNKAIPNPDAFAVNTAKMRCLTKNWAMFGLGHYIYAGESLPQSDPFTDEQKEKYVALMAAGDGVGLKRFTDEVGGEVMNELFNAAPKGEKSKQKALARELIQGANHQLKIALGAIEAALDANSSDQIAEIYGEMNETEKYYVDRALTEVQLHQINQLEQ